MFAYTFTNFGTDTESYDVSLNVDSLIKSGIVLTDGESLNISYGDNWINNEFNVSNILMRVAWGYALDPNSNGTFVHYQQSWLDKIIGTWSYTYLTPYFEGLGGGLLDTFGMTNITVIQNFDADYNWTHYRIKETGLHVFITTLPVDDNNMTKAIQETGNVTITVGSGVSESEDINFWNFATWYFGVVTGQSGNWGLPSFMSWIVRILAFIQLLSAFLLARELIPIP